MVTYLIYMIRRNPTWRKAVIILSGLFVLKVALDFFSSPSTVIETPILTDRDYVLNQNQQHSPYHKQSLTRRKTENVTEYTSINIFDVRDKHIEHSEEGHIASLRTWNGNVSMFIHKPEGDMISSYVWDYGTWEEGFLTQIGHVFFKHKDVTFVDAGCNIGVYTLFMSKLGAKVIAIDGVQENLRLLSKTLHKGNLSDHVTVIWNALSDIHKTVYLRIPTGNMGGAHIDSNNNSDTDTQIETVNTIVLDDLVGSPNGYPGTDALIKKDEKVFMKLDIEGGEDKALMSSRAFFQTANVVGIFMEWMHHRYSSGGQTIVDILVKEGFLPYDSTAMSKFLNPDSYYMWPENVFWIKR